MWVPDEWRELSQFFLCLQEPVLTMNFVSSPQGHSGYEGMCEKILSSISSPLFPPAKGKPPDLHVLLSLTLITTAYVRFPMSTDTQAAQIQNCLSSSVSSHLPLWSVPPLCSCCLPLFSPGCSSWG